MECQMSIQQNASVLKVLDAIRNLSGPSNIFVAEATILNSLRGFTQAYGDMQPLLASLVQANRLECFVPLIEKMGSCGPCGGDCCGGGCSNGACGGGCCGCGRYYRVKIG